MIRHIVMWKFRPGTENEAETFLSRLTALKGQIPELLDMTVRHSCQPGAHYDAVLCADFDDLAALERYKTDPRHVAVSSLCRAIREDRADIDVEI